MGCRGRGLLWGVESGWVIGRGASVMGEGEEVRGGVVAGGGRGCEGSG